MRCQVPTFTSEVYAHLPSAPLDHSTLNRCTSCGAMSSIQQGSGRETPTRSTRPSKDLFPHPQKKTSSFVPTVPMLIVEVQGQNSNYLVYIHSEPTPISQTNTQNPPPWAKSQFLYLPIPHPPLLTPTFVPQQPPPNSSSTGNPS